jgi:TatD DNase family protein
LQNPRYQNDLEEVLDRARQARVTALVIPGTDLMTSQAAIELADRYSTDELRIYAAVGFHPTEAHHLNQDNARALAEMAQHSSVVAIGEIGLDYYWPHNPNRDWECATPETQRRTFELQMDLASDLDLPIIVHDREAHEDTLAMLQSWQSRGPNRHGTLHAYAAGVDRLQETMDIGFMIGIDGPVTFKNARDVHAVARTVPLDRVLLETDGPYLTPVPHRGKRNEPAYLRYVAQQIAELRQENVSVVEAASTQNARWLFGLTDSENRSKPDNCPTSL